MFSLLGIFLASVGFPLASKFQKMEIPNKFSLKNDFIYIFMKKYATIIIFFSVNDTLLDHWVFVCRKPLELEIGH